MASHIYPTVEYWVNLCTSVLSASTDTPNNSQAFVTYGSTLPKYVAPLTLQILEVADIQHEWAELGGLKVEEHFKIQNQIVSYAGDLDFLKRTKEVFDNYNLLATTVAQDYTLGDNVRLCLPALSGSALPIAAPNGWSQCFLTFTLHCEVRITTLT